MEIGKELAQRFVDEVQNSHDLDAIAALFHPAFVNHAAPPGAPDGVEGVVTFMRHLFDALPDVAVTIHRQVADDDSVVTYKTFTGTHRGPLFGAPPTNTRIAIDVMEMFRVADGRFVEHWAVASPPRPA